MISRHFGTKPIFVCGLGIWEVQNESIPFSATISFVFCFTIFAFSRPEYWLRNKDLSQFRRYEGAV